MFVKQIFVPNCTYVWQVPRLNILQKNQKYPASSVSTVASTTIPQKPSKFRHERCGAGKSLARPTSRCRKAESIVSLERGVWSCDELQVFSCYRGWKEACQAMRAISTTSRRKLSSSFFFVQGKAPKEIHAILTETLG